MDSDCRSGPFDSILDVEQEVYIGTRKGLDVYSMTTSKARNVSTRGLSGLVLGVAYDFIQDKIYTSYGGAIRRANRNGTQVETILDINRSMLCAQFLTSRHLKIQSANLIGMLHVFLVSLDRRLQFTTFTEWILIT